MMEANSVVEDVIIIKELPKETNHGTPSIVKLPPTCVTQFSCIFNLAAARQPMATLHRLWTNYYPPETLVEDGIMLPGSALSFVIAGLLSFTAIKSQGIVGFPFQTHSHASMVAVTSLLMYGLASAAEQAISTPTSVYAILARLGRKLSLYILVGCLASLFYL